MTSSNTTTSSPVTVSAPGKMLLAGGYLVLERPNVGWVVAANRRFYTTVQASSEPLIRVKSPQFHSEWIYEYNKGRLSTSSNNSSINPFVEKTLRVCLLFLAPHTSQVSLDIIIQADNEFYSVLPHLQPNQSRTLEAVEALPRFLPCPQAPDGTAIVNKTGLGSSAALTTSLVGALVHYLSDEPPNTTMIHNLAQICHCHAQGKVGSGFDVSAACFGTHVYRRFPKCLLPDLLGQLEHEEATNSHLLNARDTIENLAEDEWEEDMVQPLPTGPQLQVLLADVRGGSESPGMAKTVLNWKQSQKVPPIPHWDDLKTLNAKVVSLMQSIVGGPSEQQQPEQQPATVDYDALALLPSSQWPPGPLTDLARTFSEIRFHLRSMGEAAGAPIEPPPQTKLCDATSQLPGVVTCLVPGAGGYDAVTCLYIDRPSVRQAIGTLWASWDTPIICPLNVQASSEGLRLESNFSLSL